MRQKTPGGGQEGRRGAHASPPTMLLAPKPFLPSPPPPRPRRCRELLRCHLHIKSGHLRQLKDTEKMSYLTLLCK